MATYNRYVHTQETLDEWNIVGFPQFVEFVDIKAVLRIVGKSTSQYLF